MKKCLILLGVLLSFAFNSCTKEEEPTPIRYEISQYGNLILERYENLTGDYILESEAAVTALLADSNNDLRIMPESGEVDFDTHMIIGTIGDIKTEADVLLVIEGILEQNDEWTIKIFEKEQYMEQTDLPTQPYVFIIVNKTDFHINFEHSKK